MRRAGPLDWLLRGLLVAATVLGALYRPSFAIVYVPGMLLALLIAFINPTPRWRGIGIMVLLFGCFMFTVDLLGIA